MSEELIKDMDKKSERIKSIRGIPIFLAFPESLSKEGKLGDLAEKFTFTEITSEIVPSGEQPFELLTKKILESFE